MNWVGQHKRLCLFLALLLALWAFQVWDRRFTPERWANTPVTRRAKLADSLLEQYDGLAGMTREAVTALLGEDAEGEQREERLLPGGGSQTRALLVYPLGFRPLGPFPEYLVLYLENGRVTKAEVIVD